MLTNKKNITKIQSFMRQLIKTLGVHKLTSHIIALGDLEL